MSRIGGFIGWIGIILALAGGLAYRIQPFPIFLVILVLGWALVLVWIVLHSNRIRDFLFSRQARYGAGSLLASILVLGILVFVAILTSRHSVQYDMTGNRRHSLAPQTVNILESLPAEVQATGFYQGGVDGRGAGAKALLTRYAQASDKFKFEIVDFDRQPARVQAAGIKEYDTLVIKSGRESEQIKNMNLSEDRLTNAILRVTRPGKKVIYFLTGHGERDTGDLKPDGYASIRSKLEDRNYEVKSFQLTVEENIPKDAAVIVMAGPNKDLLQKELLAVEEYLRRGGKVFILVDPSDLPEMTKFLARFNVELKDDIIIDPLSRLADFEVIVPLTMNYTQHPVLEDFRLRTLFPLARSVSVTEKKAGGVEVVTLIRTHNESSWAETNVQEIRSRVFRYKEGEDTKGPVSLAVIGRVALEGEEADADKPHTPRDQAKKEKEGKFIVIGDSDFASNANMNLGGNGDLFLSAVSWLAEEADLVSVRAKEAKTQPLLITATQASLVLWLPVVVMPLAVLIVGIIVLTSRRRRQ